MTTTLSFLVGFVYATIELLKAGLKSFGLLADDDQRAFVVRVLAVFVGIGACVALQVDVLHADAPTLAGMIITGAGLAIASDLIGIGTDLGKAKAIQIAAPPALTSSSIHLDAQSTTQTTTPAQTTTTPENAPPVISAAEADARLKSAFDNLPPMPSAVSDTRFFPPHR